MGTCSRKIPTFPLIGPGEIAVKPNLEGCLASNPLQVEDEAEFDKKDFGVQNNLPSKPLAHEPEEDIAVVVGVQDGDENLGSRISRGRQSKELRAAAQRWWRLFG